ncbi:MAG: hypothetical protein ACSNEK_06245 [Parachlamydiaceae bacterium]
MKNSAVYALTFAAAVAAFILIFIRFFPSPVPENHLHISPSNVQGAAVVFQQKPYTLNFEQQNQLIDILNRAVLVQKKDYAHVDRSFTFDQIVIYSFNGSNVEITPIDIIDQNMVFSIPLWSQDYYFMELSAGALKNLIQHSHD